GGRRGMRRCPRLRGGGAEIRSGTRWPRLCSWRESRNSVRAAALVRKEGPPMLHWALVFFVIALVAALLGFRGVAGLSAEFGWVFVVLAVIFLAVGLLSGRTPPALP